MTGPPLMRELRATVSSRVEVRWGVLTGWSVTHPVLPVCARVEAHDPYCPLGREATAALRGVYDPERPWRALDEALLLWLRGRGGPATQHDVAVALGLDSGDSLWPILRGLHAGRLRWDAESDEVGLLAVAPNEDEEVSG